MKNILLIIYSPIVSLRIIQISLSYCDMILKMVSYWPTFLFQDALPNILNKQNKSQSTINQWVLYLLMCKRTWFFHYGKYLSISFMCF